MVKKQTEGDNRQRRKAANRARKEGKQPGEATVTTGSSRQRRHVEQSAEHEERVEMRRGKLRSSGKRPNVRRSSERPDSDAT